MDAMYTYSCGQGNTVANIDGEAEETGGGARRGRIGPCGDNVHLLHAYTVTNIDGEIEA